VAAGGIVNLLTAIYNAGSAATDFWGDAIVGTDVHTWTQVTVGATLEAVYATPAVDALGSRAIFAGRTAVPAPAPTYYGSDTWGNSYLYSGHNLNSGALATWNAALPFTAGQFSGYMRTIDASVVTCAYVWVLQSKESVIVMGETAAGAIYVLGYGGADIDPESAEVQDCETDDRRYAWGTGGAAAVAAILLSQSASTNAFPNHSNSANNAHHVSWTPRAVGLVTLARQTIRSSAASATTGVKPSGCPVTYPWLWEDSGGNDMGRWREIVYCPIGRLGRRWRPAGTTLAVVGPAYSSTADDDCLACLV
jgi:hypothetical protein